MVPTLAVTASGPPVAAPAVNTPADDRLPSPAVSASDQLTAVQIVIGLPNWSFPDAVNVLVPWGSTYMGFGVTVNDVRVGTTDTVTELAADMPKPSVTTTWKV